MTWRTLQSKFNIDFKKLGTHIQIALTGLVFICMLITRHDVAQVNEKKEHVDQAERRIIEYVYLKEQTDQAAKEDREAIKKEVAKLQEVYQQQDKTLAQVQKEFEVLKRDRAKAEQTIDKMSDEQLERYLQSKTLKKK